MPRAFSEAEKKTIRSRLLAEAERQFSKFGLRKTTVDDLCAQSGISKGAFYLFFDSKDELFMEVIERAETKFRRQVLQAVEQPGASPRERLYFVLHTAFSLWRTVPVLRNFTPNDYERLARLQPPESLHKHLREDHKFFEVLIARCQAEGIPVKIPPGQLGELLYAVFFASLHVDDFGSGSLMRAIDQLLEMIAAFSLGELELKYVERMVSS